MHPALNAPAADVILLLLLLLTSSSKPDLIFTDVCAFGIREDNTNYINCTLQSLPSIPDFSKFNSVCDELILTANQITHTRPNSFEGLRSLKRIHLDKNPVSHLDADTFANVQQSLDFLAIDFDNQFRMTRLPTLPSLKFLAIRKAKMPFWSKRYPLLIGSTRLKNLTLTNCGLKGLEESTLKTFKDLENLDLSQNMRILKRFHEPVHSLRLLNLSENAIEEIEDIDYWPNLEILDASHNRIRVLPYTLPNGACDTTSVSKLKALFLQGNYIQQISPCPLSPFRQLRLLDLSQNAITEITNNPLKNCCTGLRELRIDNQGSGGLTNVDPMLLSNQKSIDLVNLNKNAIRYLSLAQAPTITQIDLSHNQLESLPNFHSSSGRIQYLNMAQNSLTYLNPTLLRAIIDRLSIRGKINLTDNPIHCTCDLLLLMNNSLEAAATLAHAECRTPDDLTGIHLDKVTELLSHHCSTRTRPIPRIMQLQAIRDESDSVLVSWDVVNPDQVIEFFIWIQVPGEKTLQYRAGSSRRNYKISNVTQDNCRACVLTLLVDNRLSNKYCTKILYNSPYLRLGKIITNRPVYPLSLIALLLLISLIFLLKIRRRLRRRPSSKRQLMDVHVYGGHMHCRQQQPRVLLTSYSIDGTAKSTTIPIGNQTNNINTNDDDDEDDDGTVTTCCRHNQPSSSMRLLQPPLMPLTTTIDPRVFNDSVSSDSDLHFGTNDLADIKHIYQELSACHCDHCYNE